MFLSAFFYFCSLICVLCFFIRCSYCQIASILNPIKADVKTVQLIVQASVCLHKVFTAYFLWFLPAQMALIKKVIREEWLKQMLMGWEIFENLKVGVSFKTFCCFCRRNCGMTMGIHSANQTLNKLSKRSMSLDKRIWGKE